MSDISKICCLSQEEAAKMEAALGPSPRLIFRHSIDEYFTHETEEVWETTDGKYLAAECGANTCDAGGSWWVYDTEEEAMRSVPEWIRSENQA